MTAISREHLDWESGLRIGAMMGIGEQLVQVMTDQGIADPATIMADAHRLASEEPPLFHHPEVGDYEYFIRGVENGLARGAEV